MRSVSESLDALGGSTAVAAALELPMTTVASWKRRNSIPAVYWAPLVDVARKRGVNITLQAFADLVPARSKRSRGPGRPRRTPARAKPRAA